MKCPVCDAGPGVTCKMPGCGALRTAPVPTPVTISKTGDTVEIRIGDHAARLSIGEWSRLISRPELGSAPRRGR